MTPKILIAEIHVFPTHQFHGDKKQTSYQLIKYLWVFLLNFRESLVDFLSEGTPIYKHEEVELEISQFHEIVWENRAIDF
jgi:hypothetical protein